MRSFYGLTRSGGKWMSLDKLIGLVTVIGLVVFTIAFMLWKAFHG